MDRLSLLKETYDEIVEARYAAIANLQSCNEAVNDAQIGVQAARNQVNAAIAEDDEIGTKLTIMRNLIGESLEKSQSLQEKFNKLTSEQIDAAMSVSLLELSGRQIVI
jgi:phage shock protein A